MVIGARTLKTGLAVIIAILISELLHLNPPIYAAVAAVLSIQPSVSKTLKHLLDQIESNIIGALLAIGAITVFDNSTLIVGVVVMLTIAINMKLGLDKNISIVVLTIIAIMESNTDNSILFATNRFSLIMVGVLSALLINFLFLPPKHENRLYEAIKEINKKISSLLRTMTNNEVDDKELRKDIQIIKEDLDKIKEVYHLYRDEFDSKLRKIKYAESRKLVLFKNFINILEDATMLIEKIEYHYNKTNNMDKTLEIEFQECLYSVVLYFEKIILKYDGKIKAQTSHQREEDVRNQVRRLVEKTVGTYDKKDDEVWIHVLPMIATVAELYYDLNHVDTLVDSYQSRHQN